MLVLALVLVQVLAQRMTMTVTAQQMIMIRCETVLVTATWASACCLASCARCDSTVELGRRSGLG